MTVEFHHGALNDSYEEQVNKQGFTFGDKAEWVQKVGFGLVCGDEGQTMTNKEINKEINEELAQFFPEATKIIGEQIEADGCDGCAFWDCEKWKEPCMSCIRNC